MKKWSTRMLVEAGLMLALAIVLSRIKIYQAPQGGSVTAGWWASMVPPLAGHPCRGEKQASYVPR